MTIYAISYMYFMVVPMHKYCTNCTGTSKYIVNKTRRVVSRLSVFIEKKKKIVVNIKCVVTKESNRSHASSGYGILAPKGAQYFSIILPH